MSDRLPPLLQTDCRCAACCQAIKHERRTRLKKDKPLEPAVHAVHCMSLTTHLTPASPLKPVSPNRVSPLAANTLVPSTCRPAVRPHQLFFVLLHRVYCRLMLLSGPALQPASALRAPPSCFGARKALILLPPSAAHHTRPLPAGAAKEVEKAAEVCLNACAVLRWPDEGTPAHF